MYSNGLRWAADVEWIKGLNVRVYRGDRRHVVRISKFPTSKEDQNYVECQCKRMVNEGLLPSGAEMSAVVGWAGRISSALRLL